MANVSKVDVSIGRTINIGNYESLRASVSLEAELAPGDTVTQVRRELNILAAEELNLVIQNMVKAYTK